MEKKSVKALKKDYWVGLATKFMVEINDKSSVPFIVMSLAEKLFIEDKPESLDDLKVLVINKIESLDLKENEVFLGGKEYLGDVNESKKSETPKKETKPKAKKVVTKETKPKTSTKTESKPKTEVVAEIKEEVKVEESTKSKLELLREECAIYGIAWGEAHKEHDLEQILSHVRNVVPPITVLEPKADFELNVDNLDEVIANAPTVSNVSSPAKSEPSKTNAQPNMAVISHLNSYRDRFTHAIRSHFRLLTVQEINAMILQDSHPFSHEILANPNQQNQVEILFKQGDDMVRLPSENANDWISING